MSQGISSAFPPAGARFALLVGILLLAGLAGPADRARAAEDVARTATTEPRKAERLKTVPISKKAWGAPRSVISLPSSRVGALAAGDRIMGAGEVQLSVCLKPNPRHPGSGHPCIGKMYGFSPTLRARIVLAKAAGDAGPRQTMAIGNPVALNCSQKHPSRNHHCVVSIPWRGMTIPSTQSLPCAPAKCRMNLVVSAHHRKAKSNNRVVVGATNDSGRIQQGKAKLSSVRLRPGNASPVNVWRTQKRATGRLPMASKGADPKRKVIYSLRVANLKAGDQLLVDARPEIRIGHLPYNALTKTEVILSNKPHSTRQVGKIADNSPRIAATNGFNCTLRNSGHSNPCSIRKTGVLSVKKNSAGPWFINVIAGQKAMGQSTMYRKWRPSHKAKIPKKGGWIRVERYRGSSSCSECSTGGWTRFSATSRPGAKKPRKLVEQLARFGISEGAYQCKRRRRGGMVCAWKAEGRFGSSPRYNCEMKAFWSKKGRRWRMKACKEALGAQLWHRLTVVRNVEPTFAGACKEMGNGNYRCKWWASGFWPGLVEYWCKGEATYVTAKHSWQIDPCRNIKA